MFALIFAAENAPLIQAEINKIDALLAKMNAARNRIGTFETQIAQLEQKNAAMVEIEQSISQLKEKYRGQAAEFERVNGQIRQMVNEIFDNLSSQELNTYQGQLEQVKARTEEMVESIEDFKELSGRLDDIVAMYDNALMDGEAEELISQVEDLENRASDIESLISDIESSPTSDDIDLDAISAPLDDMMLYGEGEFMQLVNYVDLDAFLNVADYYEQDIDECNDLLDQLVSLIDDYEALRDEMFG